jgi:nucleotide-binding universal stress UspA family protein
MTRELVATDGSPTSRSATAYAAELLSTVDLVGISVLTVIRPPLEHFAETDWLFIPQETWDELAAAAQDEAGVALQAALVDLARFDGLLRTVSRTGHHVARVIVETACELGADLIVMGAPRRGPLRGLLGGGVSNWVQRHAHCSVLLVRPTLPQVCARIATRHPAAITIPRR